MQVGYKKLQTQPAQDPVFHLVYLPQIKDDNNIAQLCPRPTSYWSVIQMPGERPRNNVPESMEREGPRRKSGSWLVWVWLT